MWIAGWLILALVAGLIGRDKRIGFWPAFLLSIVLSPLVGFIIVAISRDRD